MTQSQTALNDAERKLDILRQTASKHDSDTKLNDEAAEFTRIHIKTALLWLREI